MMSNVTSAQHGRIRRTGIDHGPNPPPEPARSEVLVFDITPAAASSNRFNLPLLVFRLGFFFGISRSNYYSCFDFF